MITTGILILKVREVFCLLIFLKKMKGTDLGMELLWVWTLSLSSSEETLASLPLHRRGEGWLWVTLTWTQSLIWGWQPSGRDILDQSFSSFCSLCWFLNACYRMPPPLFPSFLDPERGSGHLSRITVKINASRDVICLSPQPTEVRASIFLYKELELKPGMWQIQEANSKSYVLTLWSWSPAPSIFTESLAEVPNTMHVHFRCHSVGSLTYLVSVREQKAHISEWETNGFFYIKPSNSGSGLQ